MTKQRIWLLTGVILIAIGLLLGLPAILQQYRESKVPKISTSSFVAAGKKQPTDTPKPNTPAFLSGEPVRIQIPSLNIDLPVIDGYYNQTSHTWTLTKDKVQYATNTPLPNNSQGNTFLYGHNRVGVFHTLAQIKLGAQAIVTTSNGHVFTYTFLGALETNPNDDTLFHYQGAPIMTVQTCSGAFYQNRQLFTFTLTEAR